MLFRQQIPEVLCWLLYWTFASNCPVCAAECETLNPRLSCDVQRLPGTSVTVTHYRLKEAQNTPSVWAWFQTMYSHTFGNVPAFNKSIALHSE